MTKMSYKEYLAIVDDVIEKGKYKDNWESLSEHTTPAWYKKSRFGLFVHWGVYSVPAYVNEWYPRSMYVKTERTRAHHEAKYGSDFEYRQFIDMFNPTEFDADKWADLFARSGARYIMPVGEHHDGIKMYKSDLNRWNMADLKGHDYMLELKQAFEKKGMEFLCSYHRAEHYWFFNGARKYYPESEAIRNDDYRDLYGPCYLPSTGNIWRTDKEIHADKEFLEDWLATGAEFIDKLQPSAIYLDWWVQKKEFKPYLKKLLAYYYNRALEWGKEVTLFYKWGAVMNGCATFDVERGQVDGILPDLWQNDTAIAKNSWGYTENNSFKTPADLVRNLIDVVSKNGCFMLNVGPKPDGSITEEETNVLLEIGKWMSVNGEAIYDADVSELGYGEGKVSRGNGAFKDSKRYGDKDYRFTYKTGAFYVFPMTKKSKDTFKIKSLRHSNEGGIRYAIENVEILGYNGRVTYEQTEQALVVHTSAKVDNTMPICIKVSVD